MADDKKPNTERTIPPEERAMVGQLTSRIQRAIELRKGFDETTLPNLRKLVYGTETSDSDKSTTRVNLIFATIATMMPHVYAKNPEIAVTLSEAVQDGEYEKWKGFAKTAQVLVNRLLVDEAGLKRRCKSNVRSAMSTSIGWLKLTFQENLSGKDPIIMRRVNDMQDNLRQIEYLAGQVKDSPNGQDVLSKREELKQQLRSIMEQNEVKVFKGFALDRVQTEDVFVLDESVIEFDDYVHAEELAHRIWMTDDQYAATFGHTPRSGTIEFGAPTADGKPRGADGQAANTSSQAQKYRAVFEVWNKASNTIYTVALGSQGYCRAPYVPEAMPERWYNFYALGFNLVEGRFRPLSDVELLMKLQEEYSTTRYLYAEARKEAIPTRVFRKSGNLTPEDIAQLSGRRARDWIGIEGNPQTPLNQEFLQLEGIKIDPAAYDVTLIRNDMDMMVGLSDASRSNLIQAKTATEAEIMRQSLMTRVAERQDANEDLISDMARAVLEIALQKFSKAEIEELVGTAEFWPESLKVEEIFHKIRVQVRAGSTGRPNAMKEREQWTQLMPVINDTMQQVAELRTQGAFDLADAKIELLRETMRRFDERLDVDAIIPPLKKDAEGKPEQQQNMLAQAAQMKQQFEAQQQELQQCQAELQKCQQALDQAKQQDMSKAAEAEAKQVISEAQESTRQAEANAKAQADTDRARIEMESAERQATEQREAELRKTLITVAGTIFQGAMTPQAGPPDAEGNATQGAAPDINAALARVTAFVESMTAVINPAVERVEAAELNEPAAGLSPIEGEI